MDVLDSNDDFKKRYFDEETWARLQRLRESAKDIRIYIRGAWLKLFREAESLLDTDPRAEKTRDLARRWHELWEISTFGDSGIQQAQQRAWTDHRNWPTEAQEMVAELNLERIAPFMSLAIAHHRAPALSRQRLLRSYNAAARSWFRRREHLTEEAVEQALVPWIELLREAQELLGNGPSTIRVGALAVRWNELWQSATRADPRMKAVLREALAELEKWPPALQPQVSALDLGRITEFMKQAIAANMKNRYRDSTESGTPSEAWTNLLHKLWRNAGLA
ncbi:MAG TPA: hypothetical protein VIX19_20170 [Terriglobales bacterium]